MQATPPQKLTWLLLGCALTNAVCVPTIMGGSPDLVDIHVPAGFRIEVFAKDVRNARAMCWGAKGTLFVGSRDAGVVHALKDTDNDGQVNERHIVATGLNMPVGVAFKDGAL